MDKDFLLRTYGELNGPEAGPFNLSVENKYLEWRITAFFEENFRLSEDIKVCNIGIGAGYWDRYLSYRVNEGSLTSVDIDPKCCRQLKEGLENEKNPNKVDIICADAVTIGGMEGKFDIVTVIGSTREESGGYEILKKGISFLKPGGEMYYQSLGEEDPGKLRELFEEAGAVIQHREAEERYGFISNYWKIKNRG